MLHPAVTEHEERAGAVFGVLGSGESREPFVIANGETMELAGQRAERRVVLDGRRRRRDTLADVVVLCDLR